MVVTTVRPRFVPFAYGFRPFFLVALSYAAIALGAWLWIRASGRHPLLPLPSHLWHAHEMLFGFIGAAIAGFLLTAVPSWTGARGFAGLPLVALTLLWLAGRLAFAVAADMPLRMIAVVELSFLPMLAALIAPPLLRTPNRNTAMLAPLAVLWFVDALFLCALALGDIELASRSIRVGIDVVLLMVTLIGGRIVPAFTANALRQRGVTAEIRSRPWLEGPLVAAMVLTIAVDFFFPHSSYAVLIFATAALGHGLRLAGWRGHRCLRQPIVWVLHLAYAWLPLGFALRAVHAASGADWASEWLHVLTMGGAGMMIVAVITRAALGHTGRPLEVSRAVALTYLVLALAVVTRAFGPLAVAREVTVWIAGLLWLAAFAVLLVGYAPILTHARVDGKQG
jgi:uncharacterized protein involved in response to NO